jgi:uncharacterized protein with PIN domain
VTDSGFTHRWVTLRDVPDSLNAAFGEPQISSRWKSLDHILGVDKQSIEERQEKAARRAAQKFGRLRSATTAAQPTYVQRSETR